MNDCEIIIRIRAPRDGDNGYMGAVTKYPPQAGEDWSRGNDLADGPLSVATLGRIVNDIAAVMEGHSNAYDRDNLPVAVAECLGGDPRNAFGTIGSAIGGLEGWGGKDGGSAI